jgi:hypothetical protein
MRFLLAAAFLCAICSAVCADTIILRNGGKLQGKIVSENEKEVTIEMPNTGTITVKRANIREILKEKPADPPKEKPKPAEQPQKAEPKDPPAAKDAPKAKLDYAAILRGLHKDFGDKEWLVAQRDCGPDVLKEVYANMDETARDKIISNLEHVQTLVADDLAGTLGNVSILVLKDASLAGFMSKELEKMVKKNVEGLKTHPIFKPSDFEIKDFDAIKADIARRTTFVLKGEPGTFKHEFFRIYRGNVMVEVWICNIELKDKQIAGLAEKVFKRYKEALKKKPDSKEDAPKEKKPGEKDPPSRETKEDK